MVLPTRQGRRFRNPEKGVALDRGLYPEVAGHTSLRRICSLLPWSEVKSSR